MNFVEKLGVKDCTWQAFERMLSRLLTSDGYENVRQVGGSGDHGADVIASNVGLFKLNSGRSLLE